MPLWAASFLARCIAFDFGIAAGGIGGCIAFELSTEAAGAASGDIEFEFIVPAAESAGGADGAELGTARSGL